MASISRRSRASDVLDASLQPVSPVFVRPEGLEEDQFPFLGCYRYVLLQEPRLATRTRHVTQVPDSDKLSLAEFMAAPIDMPVVKVHGTGALNDVAHNLLPVITCEQNRRTA